MEKNTWVWLLAGGAALWWWTKNQSDAAVPVTVTTDPATGTTTATDVNGNNVPTTYGINGGRSTNSSLGADNFDVATNYVVLLAANPNLGDPNYQLQPQELAQYLANYLDLREAGITMATAQNHWTHFGPGQQRIFLPLVPVSN